MERYTWPQTFLLIGFMLCVQWVLDQIWAGVPYGR